MRVFNFTKKYPFFYRHIYNIHILFCGTTKIGPQLFFILQNSLSGRPSQNVCLYTITPVKKPQLYKLFQPLLFILEIN
jgi:hypothetical protein